MHPIAAVWVALLFLGVQQIEGHIVVPKVMGSALRLHPLLVIFGMLAGAEIYGVLGVFVALPFLAVLRALWEFFAGRVTFETWAPAAATPVGVSVAQPVPERAERESAIAAAEETGVSADESETSAEEPDQQETEN